MVTVYINRWGIKIPALLYFYPSMSEGYVPVIGLSDGIIDNLYAKSLEKEMKAE